MGRSLSIRTTNISHRLSARSAGISVTSSRSGLGSGDGDPFDLPPAYSAIDMGRSPLQLRGVNGDTGTVPGTNDKIESGASLFDRIIRYCLLHLNLQLWAQDSDTIKLPRTDRSDSQTVLPLRPLRFFFFFIYCLLLILARRMIVEKTDSKSMTLDSFPQI